MLISPLNDFARHLRRIKGGVAITVAAITALVVLGVLIVRSGELSPARLIDENKVADHIPNEGGTAIDDGAGGTGTPSPATLEPQQSQGGAPANGEGDGSGAMSDPEPIPYAVFEGEAEIVPIQYDPEISPQSIGGKSTEKDIRQALVDSRSVPDAIGWQLTDQFENIDATTTFIMTQSYSPLKVKDMQATVVTADNGKILSMTGQYAVMKGSLYVRETDAGTEFDGIGTVDGFDDFEKWAYIENGTVKNAVEKEGRFFDPATGEEILKAPPADPPVEELS